ncbi:MAG: hypothetical protein M1820_002252 [Bogoriella megaspora]|nr:MAG: hypothetical protein M1820_002252 [Bogoriella megaspora]
MDSRKQQSVETMKRSQRLLQRKDSDPPSTWYTFFFYLFLCLAWPFVFALSTVLTLSLPTMIKYAVLALLLRFSLFWGQNEAASFSPLLPPSFPLAVRNPYLSAWLPQSQTSDIASAKPQFWFGNSLNWSVIAKVDNETYNVFGVSSPAEGTKSGTLVSGNYTSTHTLFEISAGDALLTLDFFSPVSLTDYTRQSLPFSYLTVTAAGQNGKTPSVLVYSDIDDTWTGQSANTQRTYATVGNTSIYELSAPGHATYTQSPNEMALWGQAVFASNSNGTQLFSGSGPSAAVRGQFVQNGNLNDTHHAWEPKKDNVIGFSHVIGEVSSTTSVQFAVGYVRNETINYRGTAQTHYYRAQFKDSASAVQHFLQDYDDAYSEAQDLDNQVQTTATSIAGSKYADILALSVRQIFGAIDVVIPNSSLDTSKATAFIKEISSDGNVNTVDIIFPMLPFFYALAPQYIKLLVDPIVQYLETGGWPYPDYVIHDIGASYPNATGHDDGQAEQMPLEESGDLIILFLAYQTATGDSSWYNTYKQQLERYAIYLQQYGEYPVNQLSTTDGLGAFTNMTSLAIKSAVALSAYGKLSGVQNYTDTGKAFAKTVQTIGLGSQQSSTTNRPYLTLTYGNESWYLQFNLLPDKLFGLDTFPDSVFEDQTEFYPTVRAAEGVPIDDGANWGKTDWDSWVAAYATSTTTRDLFVNDIHAYISNGLNNMPFSDKYNLAGADAGKGQFRARPTVGAHFAIWAASKEATAHRRWMLPETSSPMRSYRRFEA